MTQIIDAYLGLTALRQAGYRSTATAVAELVDNSIEAEASEIDIISICGTVQLKKNVSKQVKQIAVLDNGRGMSVDTLSKCLSLGWGTRLETRTGLGRFGFGLKGASISQSRNVTVYSWQNSQVYSANLSLDDIRDNKLQSLNKPQKTDIPKYISKNFENKIKENGTLVLWDKLDQMDLKRPKTLVKRINKDLCRIYRHFLDDCNIYGKKRLITVHEVDMEENKINQSLFLKANDPLYQLTPNNLPGFHEESTNSSFTQSHISLPVAYLDGTEEKVSNVELRFTIANPEIQKLGGNSVVGKHYGENVGLSFVRAGREIDFNTFGFLDQSEPRHRWWGAEIRFEPALDELFGVTNNKQEVRSIKKLDDELKLALSDSAEDGDYRAKLLLDIDKIITENIKEMMKVVKSRGGTDSKSPETDSIKEAITDQLKSESTPTASNERATKMSEQDKLKERADLLLKTDTSMSPEEANSIAKNSLNLLVDIQMDDWPGSLFLDRRSVGNGAVGIINRRTEFYEIFYRHLENSSDKKAIDALKIILMALVRSEDELVKKYDPKTFEDFRSRWSQHIDNLIRLL